VTTRRSAAVRTAPAVLLLCAACGSASRAPEAAPPPVAVALETATAERWADSEVLFRCSATLTNTTSAELQVQTNFASPFDGLTVVLTGADGAEVARQAYIHHQSPYAPDGVPHPLPTGSTTQELVFPIRDLPAELVEVDVRLEGGLPGTAYETGLVSNTVRARIVPGPDATGPR
jgi:hypothetical protein